jgi:hypothetical protein
MSENNLFDTLNITSKVALTRLVKINFMNCGRWFDFQFVNFKIILLFSQTTKQLI